MLGSDGRVETQSMGQDKARQTISDSVDADPKSTLSSGDEPQAAKEQS